MVLDKRKYGLKDIISIPFKYSPFYASLLAIQRLLGGIIPVIQLLAVGKFLDTAILIFEKKAEVNEIFLPMGLVVLLIAYSWISWQILRFIEVKLELKLKEGFRVDITEKRAKLKYKHIENKETWDLISRVAKEPETQCKNSYNDLLGAIALGIRVIGLLAILFTKVWWTALLILGISIPLFYLAMKSGAASYEASREASLYRRKSDYLLKEVLSGRESADERTLFGFTEELNNRFWGIYEKARKIEFKVSLKWFIRMKTGGIITAFISVLIVIILLKPVQDGLITVGLFISISNGVFQLIQMMSWELAYFTEQIAKGKEYLKDLTNFIELDESEGALDKPLKGEIKLRTLEFKNVSFKYPGTENYILKDMSFVIEEGKHYSFVGVNGAGKTTITKLITGLYDEFEGDILINGVSVREYKLAQLKALSSVVYQDFAKYSISFKDNIALGNIKDIDNEIQNKDIDEAVKTIELTDALNDLNKGLNTNLGKVKNDGLDLSGGQWQRIAMARAVISKAELRILDEPTAALDPISESNVYEKFEEISKGGTTIFISHRLGSTKLADEIFVIENGAVIEKGSHEELINLNGEYASMYESQRSWYL